MQTQRPGMGRPTTNSYVKANFERKERVEKRLSLILFGMLSLILPPIGLIGSWRSSRIGTPARVLFSVAALASMTFFFSSAMRADSAGGNILPVPKTPMQAGYDSAAIVPTATNVPVVIDTGTDMGNIVINYGSNDTDAENTGDALPIDPAAQVTIVYAVTNNATYYHYQQMCDMQNNSRRLVLEDAIAEGLQPCEKCVLGAETDAGE